MIFDLNGNPLNSGQLAVYVGGAQSFQILIECRAGYKLRSETVGDLIVEARRNAAGAWTNIETGFIDLSAWSGTRQMFEVRLTSEGAQPSTKVFNLSVSL